jgi:hypothetical protein
VPGDVHGQPLANHQREQQRADLPPDPGPLGVFATGDDQRSPGGERPPEP